MQFNYINKPNLPSLAWCSCMEKGCDIINVYHGNSVECRKNYFVAGVWDGNFTAGDFANANFACCTGGSRLVGGGNV